MGEVNGFWYLNDSNRTKKAISSFQGDIKDSCFLKGIPFHLPII